MSKVIKTKSVSTTNYMDKLKQEAKDRQNQILYLILGYLKEHKFDITAENLLREAKLQEDQFKLCENIELDIILQEYQSYFYTKFGKYPKILRKLNESETASTKISKTKKTTTTITASNNNNNNDDDTTSNKIKNKNKKKTTAASPSSSSSSSSPPSKESKNSSSSPTIKENGNFAITVTPLKCAQVAGEQANEVPKNTNFIRKQDNVVPKEYQHLVDEITDNVIIDNINVKWEDCCGLDETIETLKESSIYPLMYPSVFKNLNPWKSVLLFGPPGTGKTLLAKALASEMHTTFFNTTSSSLLSKWIGEPQKSVKFLFRLAEQYAPSTIFLDEIDSILPKAVNDFTHNQRLKGEFLTHFDGMNPIDSKVMLLASTNSPWNLDDAILRRFDKRILVNMPDKKSRIEIFKKCLKDVDVNITDEQYDDFGDKTNGYSGSDIKLLTKEITMKTVRQQIKLLKETQKTKKQPITYESVEEALKKIKPSCDAKKFEMYLKWERQYGAS